MQLSVDIKATTGSGMSGLVAKVDCDLIQKPSGLQSSSGALPQVCEANWLLRLNMLYEEAGCQQLARPKVGPTP